MAKERLDILLKKQGFFSSREKARAVIMAGEVYVDDKMVDKAGTAIDQNAKIEVKQTKLPYVSRGGFKLEQAIKSFDLNLQNKIVADIGASTGGFTDCSLQNGAIKVYAVDVGYGQLAWTLRQDDRVIVLERTNARYLSQTEIPEKIDLATIDVAFISLTKILPAVKNLLKENGKIVALIKPQFEVGRDQVGKKGVVKDSSLHKKVIEKIINFSIELGLNVINLTFSPIKGPKGNIEYLLLLKNNVADIDIDKKSQAIPIDVNVDAIVEAAKQTLN